MVASVLSNFCARCIIILVKAFFVNKKTYFFEKVIDIFLLGAYYIRNQIGLHC